ncbi:hypothetical protein ACIP5Z_01700 [Rothia terrae]|uniref:phage tail tube protein n=1 Tax=Rothia terrae TaxID=396015 RepID=UPI0037F8CE3F
MSFTDVIVAKPKTTTGGLTFGEVGLKIPTDATSPLPEGQKNLGLVSADGVTLTEDASDEDIFVWGAVKARKVRSEYSASLGATLYSTANPDTLRGVFGADAVTVVGGKITLKHGSKTAPIQNFTVEAIDPGTNTARRFVIPRGQITVSGDRNLVDASADGFEVTIECLADDNGYCYTEYIEKTDGTTFEEPAGVITPGV